MRIGTRKVALGKLLLGVLLTTVLALSVHLVMLQVLNVPFPDLAQVPKALLLLNRVAAALTTLVFSQIAFQSTSRSFLKRWGTLSLLVSMITETLLRAPFMDGYCTNAFSFTYIQNLPRLLSLVALSGFVAAASPWLHKVWQKVFGAIAITTLVTFVATPLIGLIAGPATRAVAHLAPAGEWCRLPYGANVLIPAYISFLEPVLAGFAAAALVWEKLSDATGRRFFYFCLLIVGMKSQLLAPFIYAAVAKGPFVRALASDGQFACEALALALLVGCTWTWSMQPRSSELSAFAPDLRK